MAETHGNGSLPNKALIALLLAVLAVLIAYPRALSEKENKRRELCRDRLTNWQQAAQQYQKFRYAQPKSLDEILAFVKYDTAYQRALGEIVTARLRDAQKLLGTLQQKQRSVDTLSAMVADASRDTLTGRQEDVINRSRELRARLEAIREDMVRLPALPVAEFDRALEIIERKEFFSSLETSYRIPAADANRYDAVIARKENIANLDSIDYHIAATLQSMTKNNLRLDSLIYCPTVFRPYILECQENSGHRLCKFSCPIDENDVESARSDLLRYRLGAFVIQNHGFIHAQGKSWQKDS